MGNHLSAPAASFDGNEKRPTNDRARRSLEKANAFRFDASTDDDACVGDEDDTCDESDERSNPLDLDAVGGIKGNKGRGVDNDSAPEYGVNDDGAPEYGVNDDGAPEYGVNDDGAPEYDLHKNSSSSYDTSETINQASTSGPTGSSGPATVSTVRIFPENVSQLKFAAKTPANIPFPFVAVVSAMLI
jgi:hypothetical protein